MRILYISDRGKGGIKNHVKCLLECLKGVDGVETYCIGEDEPFAGRSGHDLTEWKQIRRVIKTFKPNIIHLHTLPFLMCLYIKLFVRAPLFVSLHVPWDNKPSLKDRLLHWLVKGAYYLPVSSVTWSGFKKWVKGIKGEVFFNPIIIKDMMRLRDVGKGIKGYVPVIGAVGRNADVKDWPSFVKITSKILQQRECVEVWGVGVTEDEARNELGDEFSHIKWKGFVPNGRELIGQMDVYVLTSKSEELPTVVLESFSAGTAICGFIPKGGMVDILSFSNGALKEVFIEERDADKLASIVLKILNDDELRKRIVEDGWQIVTNHFDAVKNCRGQLLEIYRRFIK